MDLQDPTDKNGPPPIKFVNARLITSQNKLMHIVQLDKYRESIDRIQASLATFDNTTEYRETLEIVKGKAEEVETKLLTMMSQKRTKSGLINGLGTIIKSITANLDVNDAIRMNSEIEKILANEGKFETKLSQQLNGQIIERFENNTSHINQQKKTLII